MGARHRLHWGLDAGEGVGNVAQQLLMRVGLVNLPVPWGIYDATAWLMVFVANAWRGAPFFAIVLLAALQSIPLSTSPPRSTEPVPGSASASSHCL